LTKVIAFYESMAGWVDEGEGVDVIYLKFSKVFDAVSHNILIGKLGKSELEERTVRWIENWLNGRTQRVVIFEMVLEDRTGVRGLEKGQC